MDFLEPFYLWFKALHVISVISWMAGILYLPRLFIRHVEFGQGNQEIADMLVLMEDKLFRIIMNPAMMASWFFGVLMLVSGLVDYHSIWFLVKLVAVIAMTWFHFWCKARKNELERGEFRHTSKALRIANEVPTFLMVVIVFMVVLKPFS